MPSLTGQPVALACDSGQVVYESVSTAYGLAHRALCLSPDGVSVGWTHEGLFTGTLDDANKILASALLVIALAWVLQYLRRPMGR